MPVADDRVVFYGSSSIRMWKTLAQDFPTLNTLNLGFGGSTMAACDWFFERLLIPAKPAAIVFYAGDNDLGDGRHPEEVYLFFYALLEKRRLNFPDVPLTFLSIKTSIARWNLKDQIRQTNELVRQEIERQPIDQQSVLQYIDVATPLLDAKGFPRRDYFEADGLHLTPTGYEVWRQTLIQYPTFVNNLVKAS